jgi:hypothetical protein
VGIVIRPFSRPLRATCCTQLAVEKDALTAELCGSGSGGLRRVVTRPWRLLMYVGKQQRG